MPDNYVTGTASGSDGGGELPYTYVTDPSPAPTWTDSVSRNDSSGVMGTHTLQRGSASKAWTLGDSPWIPALVVGCGMAVLLSLSFYSHHKRVRRKRELVMDYLSALLYSGAWTRGRSVSILCNTNFIALSELGRSFKIKVKDDVDSAAASEFLREKYLKDFLAFTNARGKRKRGLKRFISAPAENKFRRVACQLVARNSVMRLQRGGLGALARNLSMPGGPFDSYDFDFPASLAEARKSITQGVLLDPSRMQEDNDGNSVGFQRPPSTCESCFNHSCESAATPGRMSDPDPEQPSAPKAAQVHFSVAMDDHPVDCGAPPSELSLARGQACEHLCARAKSAGTSAVLESSQPNAAESRSESFDSSRASPSPLSTNDVSVSVTCSSAVPQCDHAFRPTRTLHYSPRVVDIPDDHIVSFDNPFREEPEVNACYPNDSAMRCNMNSQTCVVYSSRREHGSSKYVPGFTGGVGETDVHIKRNQQSCAVCRVNTYSAPYPRYQNPLDKDRERNDGDDSREYTLLSSQLHTKSLEEHKREVNFPDPGSPAGKRAITYTKSLEYSMAKSPRRYQAHNGVNSMDFNPLFPGETHSSFSIQNPPSFFPSAFSRQLSPLAQEGREGNPDNAFGRIRAPKLATAKTTPFCSSSKISKDFRPMKPKCRGALCKTLSTQSTRALISGSGTPPQGFGSQDSDQCSPTPAAYQRFFSLHETSDPVPVDNNNDPVTFAARGEMEGGVQSLQRSVPPEHYFTQRAFSLKTVGEVTFGDSSSASRKLGDVHKWETDTMLPLESLSSAREQRSEVRQTSNVHRLPRFQVRSGVNQHRKLLAQHCHMQGGWTIKTLMLILNKNN